MITIQLADGTYKNVEPVILPREFDRQMQSWDLTFKNGEGVDNVAGGVIGTRGAGIYLLDAVYSPMSFVQTISAITALSAKWPNALIKYIEEKANGSAVYSMLQHKLRGIVMVEPKGKKVERAAASSDLVYAGNVYLPHPKLYPWVMPLVDQMANFPNVPNDDYVDMMSQVLLQLMYSKDAIPKLTKNIYQKHKEQKAREARKGHRINRRF
jgi:predicted phage terminase large subunit-like protein